MFCKELFDFKLHFLEVYVFVIQSLAQNYKVAFEWSNFLGAC